MQVKKISHRELDKCLKKKRCKNILKGLIGFMILTVIFLSVPNYLKKALFYGHAGIYDYTIFENRLIDTGKPEPWPKADAYNHIGPSEVHLDSLKLLETTSFLIVQNDSLLYEYISEDITVTSISNSFSMAKSFVGLLVGCAISDGYIESVNQLVDQFLPNLTNLHGKGLTIEHLLTMSSGSNWDESYGSPFSITTKAYYGSNLDGLMEGIQLIEKPGLNFRYKSGDTQLLAMILAKATGKTLSDYASEKLWCPIGAENAALWSLDDNDGVEKAYCCFNSTARDFARFGALILNHGRWKEQQIIPESYIIQSITPASYLNDEQKNPLTYYGYHWWILNHKGMQIPYARGIQGQYIFVLPTKNAVIVRLGHQRSEEKINHHPVDVYTWVDMAMQILEP